MWLRVGLLAAWQERIWCIIRAERRKREIVSLLFKVCHTGLISERGRGRAAIRGWRAAWFIRASFWWSIPKRWNYLINPPRLMLRRVIWCWQGRSAKCLILSIKHFGVNIRLVQNSYTPTDKHERSAAPLCAEWGCVRKTDRDTWALHCFLYMISWHCKQWHYYITQIHNDHLFIYY